MTAVGIAGQALKYLEIVADLASVVRGVINSYDAGTLTPDAGMDFAGLVTELILLGHALATTEPSGRAPGAIEKGIVEICFLVVYGTLTFFTFLEFLNGVGYPYFGDSFQGGKSNFEDIDETLKGAVPDDSKWSGDTAFKYADLNRQLGELVGAMGEADGKVSDIVQRQADQVQQAREAISGAAMGLVGVLLLTATLSGRTYASLQKDAAALKKWISPASGAAVEEPLLDQQQAAEGGASPQSWLGLGGWIDTWLPYIVLPPCIMALGAAEGCLLHLIAQGSFNAGDLQDQIHSYRDVHRAAVAIVDGAPDARFAERGASQSTIAHYWQHLVPADDSATLLGLSKAAGVVDAPAGNGVPVGAVVGNAAGFGNRALAAAVPEPQPPPLAGPVQAALGQSAEAAAMFSEEVFAVAQVDDGLTEQMPALAVPVRRPADPAPKPTRKKSAFADDDDGESDASGQEFMPGVPVGVVTVSAKQALEPGGADSPDLVSRSS